MKLLYTYISFFIPLLSFTQDVEATKLMSNLESHYEKYGYKLEFQISIKEPESKIATVKQGVFNLLKNFYSMELDDLKIYFNGSTQWSYFVDRKEVQITNSTIDESSYHPLKFIKLYKTNEFKYRLISSKDNISKVELVPIAENQEYFKVKLGINKKLKRLTEVELFLKNGSKIKITLLKHLPLSNVSTENFTLDTQKLKGVHIEDLR